MTARVLPPVPSPYAAKAIITLDPAGVGDVGIAVRLTAHLPKKPVRGKLAAPDWTYQGSVWNDVMYDDLTVFLAKGVGRTGHVFLAHEHSSFGSFSVATSIGTGIGAIRGLLVGCGWMSCDTRPKGVTPNAYRLWAWPSAATRPKGRAEYKIAAIEMCQMLYGWGDELQSDLAEATILNDYVVVMRPELWKEPAHE